MPVLPNQRHELFAHAIVKGFTPAVAYQKANFTGKRLSASSSYILNTPEVSNRISELQEQAAEVFVAGNIAKRNYRIAVLNEIVIRLMGRFRSLDLPNTGEVREIRECLKQASIESGQWEEKQQIAIVSGENDYSRFSEDQIQAALDKMKEARAMLNAIPADAESLESSVIEVSPVESGV